MDIWLEPEKMNPDQWAKEKLMHPTGTFEARLRVRLADGREIFTWWKNSQWSVERLKPNLKVKSWRMPVLIA